VSFHLPFAGLAPHRVMDSRVPASFSGLAQLLNPSTFLTTFSASSDFFFGIAIAQAPDQQATGTKWEKEVMNV
jgi:hypothetical protein